MEYGDFQTPRELAKQVCDLLRTRGTAPQSIVEPTCGRGSLLVAALDRFPSVQRACGLEINADYVAPLRDGIIRAGHSGKVKLHHADFFAADWTSIFDSLPEPVLVIGNPPWVTNAALSRLGSENLPPKTNFQNHSGLDAITGKSNFDVSEWMLNRLVESLDGRCAAMAFLCKSAVARKVLASAWRGGMHIHDAAVYGIDSLRHFGAAVDACLFVCEFDPHGRTESAEVYDDLMRRCSVNTWGLRDGEFVPNAHIYDESRQLRSDAGAGPYVWRSGVKHDCSKVMELRRNGNAWVNKAGESVELESDCLYPMLKSSDVANGRTAQPRNWMLITQRSVGEDTAQLQRRAPKTWDYLCSHGERLDERRSSIYRNRPRFSIFGVGSYAFAPYKVAISGFYKRLSFEIVGPYRDKPVVLDDTSYFLPCQTQAEASFLASLLNSREANAFYSARVFWDAKRPITAELLRKLDLRRLACQLGREEEFDQFALRRGDARKQPTLF